MYGKIIVKNVAKNIKDYGVYFLTLLIAVAVFYSFNSIETQPVIQDAINSNASMIGNLIPMIHLISKLVAVMLAFLIIYANSFLLKRRKKELGIYMILGMSESRMSGIFVGETILIGMAAMFAGVGIGCVLSQGISIFAIKMFAYDLSGYRFIFSVSSLKETVLCFVIIFIVVIIFNVRTITKVKLIDMLNASRKNEKMTVEKISTLALVFLCSIILYGISGYLLYFKDGLSFKTKQPVICTVAICVATAMLIYSIAGIVLKILQKKKNWYLKGINSFLVRQISSKIQTNFITMTVVSLLLTGTICIISLGMGMADTMNDTAKDATPYDVMIFKDEEGVEDTKENYYAELQKNGLPLDDALAHYEIIKITVDTSLTYKEILSDTENLAVVDKKLPDEKVTIISISDYNAALELQGKEPIELPSGTYMLNSNYRGTNDNIQKKYNEQMNLTIAGRTLKPANKDVLHNTYYMTVVGTNDSGTIIVSDEISEQLQMDAMILVGNYRAGFDEAVLIDKMIPLIGDTVDSSIAYYTKTLVNEMYYGTFAVLAFVCCYIGVILLIICVAILSLQQLTETNDNVKRYQLLGKLGVESKIQNSALLKQVLVYFGVPLLIAIVYAVAGLPKAVEKLRDSMGMEVGTQVVVIVIIMLIVYGSYFILTYLSCKRIISEKTTYVEE